jgi:hypothetical protein
MQRRRLRIQPDANSIQEYAKKLNLEFLSPYLINRDDQEELSIPMGLIIVPCQLMISKHHYSHLYTNLSSK